MNAVQVDPAVIQAAIVEYKNIHAALDQAHRDGEVLTQLKGPGKDMPSQVYANIANKAGGLHQQANMNLQKAILARVALLETTLKQYQESDRL
jgi:hypothetical protein